MLEYALLFSVAVSTSLLTAIVGIGGGVLLLGILAVVVSPAILLPAHAFAQLSSNFSRALFYRNFVWWRQVCWQVIGVSCGAVIAYFSFGTLDEDLWNILLGSYLFFIVLLNRLSLFKVVSSSKNIFRNLFFIPIGLFQGWLAVSVGISGPFQIPFLRKLGISHVSLIGTLAAMNSWAHISRVFVYTKQGLMTQQVALLAFILALGALIGSWLGHRVRNRFTSRVLAVALDLLLVVLGMRMIWRSL